MTDEHFPPPPPAEPVAISRRTRRMTTALTMVLIGAAIFLEQWCHFKSMPHPTSAPPNGSASHP